MDITFRILIDGRPIALSETYTTPDDTTAAPKRLVMNMRIPYPEVFQQLGILPHTLVQIEMTTTPTHTTNWKTGDPCHTCGSTNTYLVHGLACCLNCNATDADE